MSVDESDITGDQSLTDPSAGPGNDHPRNAIADWITAHPLFFRVALWTVVIGSIAAGSVLWAIGKLDASNVGYGGVFAINLIGSASVLVPVPGLAAACAAAAPSVGLGIPGIAVLGAVGSTLGETTGYMAGYGGQAFIQKIKHYDRVHRIVTRRGGVALFVLAAVPNPVFDIAGFASGSLGYPMRKFLLWVGLGKLLKFTLIAYACRYSIEWIVRLVH